MCAIKYDGTNVKEIEEFLENKIFIISGTNDLKCKGTIIHPEYWVIRRIKEIEKYEKKLDQRFEVMHDVWFNELYKRTGKCYWKK